MKKWAYYNDNDAQVCEWVRNLIKAGLVPDGEVDSRSIVDVKPEDVRGFTRCHFFCGILGWELALQMAGWPEDRPVWTGSCPCQPYSNAGRRKGDKDERNLWPEFRRLVRECLPPTVFGEQVASKAGRAWLSGVRADLEDLGYAVGAADLCAAGIGAPHIRQRLWWVADGRMAYSECPSDRCQVECRQATWEDAQRPAGGSGRPSGAGRVGDSNQSSLRGYAGDSPEEETEGEGEREQHGDGGVESVRTGSSRGLADSPQNGRRQGGEDGRRGLPGVTSTEERLRLANGSEIDGLHLPDGVRLPGPGCGGGCPGEQRVPGTQHEAEPCTGLSHSCGAFGGRVGPGFWDRFDLIPCADGKARRVEPGVEPLAHGIPARVVKLRAYGNAIVPQVAAEFIRAYLGGGPC